MLAKAWRYAVGTIITIITISLLGMILLYIMEPAGLFVQWLHIMWMASLKRCLRSADYFETISEDLVKTWHESTDQRWPYILKPPRYLIYAVNLSQWSAAFLRLVGDFMARGVITYRNNGAVLRSWPARFVVTTRGLFARDWIRTVSFSPTWARHVLG
ncbi:hypothetical protein DHEL01_v209989 [Diaporthe helianthi]|uniref:Uncharacterized protein n=1 Tax=Diaporthe helianthi TaxID=158607 RepID=A0A2P5HMY7_DIAHE|nr:hypothetical protein DHEL01_v209989 [Diaporthe helianthi]